MFKYPQKFETYWSNAAVDLPGIEYWQIARVKHIAYLAWKAGRRSTTLAKEI